MRDSDFRMELKHLLGDARFRSIRQHCLVYENLRKRGFVAIPWRESDRLQADEISPYKLQQIWQTLNWLSKIFGLLKVDEHQRLVTKKKALEEELAPTVVRPQKKAAVPSREVIWALEEGAALGGPPGAPGPAAPAQAAPVGNATSSWMPSFWALPASRWAAVPASMTYNMSARRNSGPPPIPLNSRPGRQRWQGQLGFARNRSR